MKRASNSVGRCAGWGCREGGLHKRCGMRSAGCAGLLGEACWKLGVGKGEVSGGGL